MRGQEKMVFKPNQIIEARNYAALVVARHGEAYLPLFERMEREVSNLEDKEDALARALHLAERHFAA
jgi:hypothetical protein